MSFQFRLESLLKYRRYQLQQCQQLMAEILQDTQRCELGIAENQQERLNMYEHIRTHHQASIIDVHKLTGLRIDVVQLDHQLTGLQAHRDRCQQQLQLCRQAVQQADAAVKALERLEEKQNLEYLKELNKKEDREQQDLWASTQQILTAGKRKS